MESHDKKSEQAASEADQLAEQGDRVDKHIEETKRDWEAKQGDQSVPGAVPDPGEDEEATREPSDDGEPVDSAGQ